MENMVFSDYGSGSSNTSSWNSLDSWPSVSSRPQLRSETTDRHRQYQSADLLDLMVRRSTLQDMMDEFKMNGYDTPYNPDENNMSSRSGALIGMGSSSVYLRQKSWPEPEATPAQRLPRPNSEWIQSTTASEFTYSDRDFEITPPLSPIWPPSPVKQLETISAEQVRVLNSLPDAVLYGLLRDLEHKRNEAARTKRVPDAMMVRRSTLQDMMDEFKMNGYDTPYNPDENNMSSRSGALIGMGSSSVYLRQKSWPEPEATPAQRLPRPNSEWIQSTTASEFTYSDRDFEITPPLSPIWPPSPVKQLETISAEQVRVLNSLPDAVLYGLLRDLEHKRNEAARTKRVPDECRFCKNNGERESYYRSHVLKDASGRVSCPVLRKFVCKRCGARGDRAHTVKYCPLSTDEERVKSTAMMRSVRLASGRRRAAPEPAGDYVMFGDTSPSVLRDYRVCAPLDPLWADLEHKLTF